MSFLYARSSPRTLRKPSPLTMAPLHSRCWSSRLRRLMGPLIWLGPLFWPRRLVFLFLHPYGTLGSLLSPLQLLDFGRDLWPVTSWPLEHCQCLLPVKVVLLTRTEWGSSSLQPSLPLSHGLSKFIDLVLDPDCDLLYCAHVAEKLFFPSGHWIILHNGRKLREESHSTPRVSWWWISWLA